jgi:hypothetical protein
MAVFGDGFVAVKKSTGHKYSMHGVVYLPDTRNKLGSVRTDFEEPRIQTMPGDAETIEIGDTIEYGGKSYSVYDVSDDDIDGGLVTLWMRQNAD